MDGLSGQYGSIPYHAFLEKYELTNIDEDPFDVDTYQRNILLNSRCDKPFFESDQPRDNASFAQYKIDMQYEGKPDPYAPDLFLEHTDRDPRGTALEPNFSRVREHAMARAGDIKFSPDDPGLQIQESQKSQEQLQRQKDDVFYEIKDRMRWFATSKDNMASGRNFRGAADTQLRDVVTNDPALSRVASDEATGSNQWYGQLGRTPVGWDRTTDQEFTIASYGHIRTQRPMDTIAERANQQQQSARESAPARAAQTLALLMRDAVLEQQSRRAMSTATTGTPALVARVRDRFSVARVVHNQTVRTDSTPGSVAARAPVLGAQRYDAMHVRNVARTAHVRDTMVARTITQLHHSAPRCDKTMSTAMLRGGTPAHAPVALATQRARAVQVLGSQLVDADMKIAVLGQKRAAGTESMLAQRAVVKDALVADARVARTRAGMAAQSAAAHHAADESQTTMPIDAQHHGTTRLGSKYTRELHATSARTSAINDQ